MSATASNVVAFSGSGCGAANRESVGVPAKAIGITPLSPSAGYALQDGLFGEGTVAHITSVTTSRDASGAFQVVWTAIGSNAACDPTTVSSTGWSTDTVTLSVNYGKDVGSRVYWRSIRNRPVDQVRPRFHSVLADVRFERMRWTSWGGRTAVGVGYVGHDDFLPNGHGGYRYYDQLARATFHLFKIVYCDNGRLIYTRLRVHTLQRSGGLKRYTTFKYDCGGGNGVG